LLLRPLVAKRRSSKRSVDPRMSLAGTHLIFSNFHYVFKRFYTFSIKCAATYTPKPANFKIFLLLFSHRVTRIEHLESRTFFASNAHVRPIYGGTSVLKTETPAGE
jgi:hypothetical protein